MFRFNNDLETKLIVYALVISPLFIAYTFTLFWADNANAGHCWSHLPAEHRVAISPNTGLQTYTKHFDSMTHFMSLKYLYSENIVNLT